MLGRYTTGPDVARAEHSRWTGGCLSPRGHREAPRQRGQVCDHAGMDVVAVPLPVFVILGVLIVVAVVGAWLLRRD